MVIQLNSQILNYEHKGQGNGQPVILLHGNGEDLSIFDVLSESIAKDHEVYAIDSRGQGMSAPVKELHYSDMAEDLANFIDALEIEKPILLGYSDGAIVALLYAMKHSNKISKVIACSANLSPKGIDFWTRRQIKKEFNKTKSPITEVMLKEPNILPQELKAIKVPVTVICGSKDCIKLSETKKIADSINDSVMVVLKGHTHFSYVKGKAILKDYI